MNGCEGIFVDVESWFRAKLQELYGPDLEGLRDPWIKFLNLDYFNVE